MEAQPVAEARVLILQRSLRCFVFGCVALIPVFGFPFAVLAFLELARVRRLQRGSWNPAQHYAVTGACLALFGGLMSVLCFVIAGIGILNALAVGSAWVD